LLLRVSRSGSSGCHGGRHHRRRQAGVPKALFEFETRTLPVNVIFPHVYHRSADGRRFLIINLFEEAEQRPVSVVVNWQAGLSAEPRP